MPMLTKTPHIIHISQYAGAIQHVSVKRLTENVLIRNTNRFLESLFLVYFLFCGPLPPFKAAGCFVCVKNKKTRRIILVHLEAPPPWPRGQQTKQVPPNPPKHYQKQSRMNNPIHICFC